MRRSSVSLVVFMTVALAVTPLTGGVAMLTPHPGPPLVDAEGTTPGALIRAELQAASARLGITPTPMGHPPCPSLDAAVAAHFAYYGLTPPGQAPLLDDPVLEQAIACVLDAQRRADLARDVALEAAGIDLREWAQILLSDDPALHDAAPTFDIRIALGAADLLAVRIDALLQVIAQRDWPTVPLAGETPTAPPEFDLPPVLAVDRIGHTLYDLDYALIVDTVGNDLYDNNAGGGMIAVGGGPTIPPTGNESSWQHVVAPAGENAPHVVVGGQFEDSEVIISAAVAVDTDGDDVYGVYRPPGRDAICTDEPIVRRVATQGAGVIGPAMLVDTAGHNQLRARVIAQGNGHVGGVGVLYLGPGNDEVRGVRSVQGSGVFGGIGILINEGGDDHYWAHIPAGGTFNADLGFCDTTARYVQGSGFGRVTGAATGVYGALHDLAGNDVYDTDLKGQGFGMVFGVGILTDQAGDDLYIAGTKAMGYAEGHSSTGGPGMGLLYDAAGHDTYQLGAAPGIGMGGGADPGQVPSPYMPPAFWVNEVIANTVDPLLLTGAGIMWDRSGEDAYSLPNRGNGMQDTRGGTVGVFMDDA